MSTPVPDNLPTFSGKGSLIVTAIFSRDDKGPYLRWRGLRWRLEQNHTGDHPMSGVSVDFRFELGDVVFGKSARHSKGLQPKAFTVIERMAQQCSGGIQLLYKLDGEAAWTPEIALTKDEPPYRPISDAEIEDEVRLRNAMTRRWTDFGKEKPKGGE